MLKGIIQSLKDTQRWEPFVDFFKKKRDAALENLMNKAPNIGPEDIDKANFEIEMFESLMNLDKWVERTKEG